MQVPTLVATNMEPTVREAFKDVGVSDWNSVFWAVHPGGPAILDQIEAALGLHPDKLRCSRHVLSEYGNMASACVLFVLHEMRTSSARRGEATTGEGFEWGVLYGFGPGLTVETVLLRAVPIDA